MNKNNHSGEKAFNKVWARIVAKAWTDKAFKKRLMENPYQVLRESGLEIPADFKFQVHENAPKIHHLVIPEMPNQELDEKMLENISAGSSCDW